jgi:hypothetical protein
LNLQAALALQSRSSRAATRSSQSAPAAAPFPFTITLMHSLSTSTEGRAGVYGGALRLLKDEDEGGHLPTLATPSDVREAVRYLMRKPAGVSLAEALGDAKRRVFEPRKVAAYEAWGLVERRGSRVVLSAAGREFARRLAPEAEAYRDLLASEPVYRAALEWMHRQQAELFTHSDLTAFLRGQPALLPEQDGDGRSLEGGVVCFFHLCQAAELGTVTIGKRGQPARLRVEREELAAWVARRTGPRAEAGAPEPRRSRRAEARGGPALRLYVSCGTPAPSLLGELRRTLELVDIESHVRERGAEAGRAVPFADAAAELMRGCDAGLLVIAREDYEAEGGLGRDVLVEAGAAYVLYAGRVVILHEEGTELPDALGELPRFAFRRDGLSWEVGLELLRAIKGLVPERRAV